MIHVESYKCDGNTLKKRHIKEEANLDSTITSSMSSLKGPVNKRTRTHIHPVRHNL